MSTDRSRPNDERIEPLLGGLQEKPAQGLALPWRIAIAALIFAAIAALVINQSS